MIRDRKDSGGKPPFRTEHFNRKRPPRFRIGVDTGGTFTDFVFEQNGRLEIFKLPSTPADPSVAISNGLSRILQLTGSQTFEVIHGTTVGTNALLQRRGARTALITTKGFEDVLVIGRQARPELYNLDAVRALPLVPDDLRLGLQERIAASGEVLEALDPVQLKAIIAKLRKARVESVAVSLLFSFAHPQHEQAVAAALASLNVPLSISHQILPEYREYERTSTVTINAYLQPLMGTYLDRLSRVSFQKTDKPATNKQSPKTQRPKVGFSLACYAIFRWEYFRGRRCQRTSAHDPVRPGGRNRRRSPGGAQRWICKRDQFRHGRNLN